MKQVLLFILILVSFSGFSQNEIILKDGEPGFAFKVKESKVYVNKIIPESSADKVNIKKFDEIIAINDLSISNKEKYKISNLLAGTLGSTVNLTINRGGKTLRFSVIRDQISSQSHFIDFKMAYHIMTHFNTRHQPHYFNYYIQNTKNITIDSIISLFNKNLIPNAIESSMMVVVDSSMETSSRFCNNDQITSINGISTKEANIFEILKNVMGQDSVVIILKSAIDASLQEITIPSKDFEFDTREALISSSSSFWVVIPLKFECSPESSFIIKADKSTVLEAYIQNGHSLVAMSTKNRNNWLEEKTLPNQPYIRISKNKADSLLLYLKVNKTLNENNSTIHIENWDYIAQKDMENRTTQGLFFGIMLIMALYNIIMAFFMKNANYLLFGLYVFGFGLFMAILDGYIIHLKDVVLQAPFILGSMVCFIIFMQNFLDIKILLPKWNKIFKTVTYMLLFTIIAMLLAYIKVKELPRWTSIILGTIITMSSIFYIVSFIPTIKLIKRHKPAIYILVANITLLSAGLTSLAFSNVSYIQAGVVVQILIFSVSMGQRIANTEKEKNKALKENIAQLKENDDLREKVNRELEQKVKERTEDLEQANAEIQAQRDNLKLFNDEISASITYAERIQRSILPDEQLLYDNLTDHFILFKPRDMVSGDFYWFKKINNHLIITAADCTGHGVPGAFMSMLGISFLNEIVSKNRFDTTNIILDRLRNKVKSVLRQKGEIGENKDGMDMAICTINLETLELQYSGAYNPLYIIRNNELITIKADRQPIAVYINEKPFNLSNFQLEKGDCLYMFSDGYADQFGGKLGKKFMTKNLKQLLLNYHSLPMPEQKNICLEKFETWKNGYEQMDDVLLMGIKI